MRSPRFAQPSARMCRADASEHMARAPPPPGPRSRSWRSRDYACPQEGRDVRVSVCLCVRVLGLAARVFVCLCVRVPDCVGSLAELRSLAPCSLLLPSLALSLSLSLKLPMTTRHSSAFVTLLPLHDGAGQRERESERKRHWNRPSKRAGQRRGGDGHFCRLSCLLRIVQQRAARREQQPQRTLAAALVQLLRPGPGAMRAEPSPSSRLNWTKKALNICRFITISIVDYQPPVK